MQIKITLKRGMFFLFKKKNSLHQDITYLKMLPTSTDIKDEHNR